MSAILPSSPPASGGQRRMPSPVESEYSVDVDEPDIDAQSDASETSLKQQLDSEDIDGPSYFTQNEEMWMRGGPMTNKGTLSIQSSVINNPVVEKDEPVELQDHPTSLSSKGDGAAMEHGLGKIPNLEEPPPEDQFSSEWYPNGQSATPGPTALKKFLQPAVEDYNSELTLGNQTPAQTVRNRSFAKDESFRGAPQANQSVRTPSRQPTPSPLRHASQPETSAHEDTLNEIPDELQVQLEQLRARCDQLELVNVIMTRTLEAERETRRQESASHSASIMDANRKERDLVKAVDTAQKERDEMELRLEAQIRGSEANSRSNGVTAAQQQLADELQRRESEHIRTVRAMQQDLEHARRDRDATEDLAKKLREESAEQRDVHEAEAERLRLELKQAREDELAIADLDQQLDIANGEIKRLKEACGNSDKVVKTLREELETTKQSHTDQISRTTEDHIRAVELASNLQRQLQEVRQQLREAQATKETAPSGQSQVQGQDSGLQAELSATRSELESKQVELNEAILERDAAQDELDSTKAELAEHRSVSAALDASISETMRRRETHLRGKLKAAEEQCDLMAKALMHRWGREEVGTEQPQGYAYKYSSAKSGMSSEKSKVKANINSGKTIS